MGDKTSIEWTDRTWNPWQGCTRVSEGCKHCYMAREKRRYGKDPWRVVRSAERTFAAPLARNRAGDWKWPDGDRVFVCSWSDVFHAKADAWREEAWAIMRERPGLTFQILTKRPERVAECWWGKRALPNVWLGVSAENQAAADARVPILLKLPAAVRFVSCEPLLGAVDLRHILHTDPEMGRVETDTLGGRVELLESCSADAVSDVPVVDWVIAGGESGPGARPTHPDWLRWMRGHCAAQGVPFFFKQWGEWAPFYDRDRDDPDWRRVPRSSPTIRRLNLAGGAGFHGERVVYCKRVGKHAAGRLLDGRTHDGMPVLEDAS